MTEQPTVTIYTDGGSQPNPGPGGWAAVLIAENGYTKELSGHEPDTTNNRMELTAAIQALRALKQPSHVTLVTDSEYLKNGITRWLPGWVARGWRRKGDKPVQNEDLWRALQAETERHTIDWRWVRGHAGHAINERVDRLATQARQALTGPPPATSPAPATAPDSQVSGPIAEVALRITVPRSGGPGGWAARIAWNETDRTPVVHTGAAARTTSNRLILTAALSTLQQIPRDVPARIHCPDDYLFNGMTAWLRNWQARGWKTAGGEPVKNQDLWQALAEEAAQRSIAWVAERNHPTDLARGLEQLATRALEND